jgi:hypothetical protein
MRPQDDCIEAEFESENFGGLRVPEIDAGVRISNISLESRAFAITDLRTNEVYGDLLGTTQRAKSKDGARMDAPRCEQFRILSARQHAVTKL